MSGAAILAALLRLTPWMLAALLGAVAWHQTPVIGPGAQLARAAGREVRLADQLDAAQEAAGAWEAHARGWEANARQTAALRRQERDQARASASDAAQACAARVAAARRSSAAIDALIRPEPAYDPTACPARRLLDPDQLRDAVAPPAPR